MLQSVASFRSTPVPQTGSIPSLKKPAPQFQGIYEVQFKQTPPIPELQPFVSSAPIPNNERNVITSNMARNTTRSLQKTPGNEKNTIQGVYANGKQYIVTNDDTHQDANELVQRVRQVDISQSHRDLIYSDEKAQPVIAEYMEEHADRITSLEVTVEPGLTIIDHGHVVSKYDYSTHIPGVDQTVTGEKIGYTLNAPAYPGKTLSPLETLLVQIYRSTPRMPQQPAYQWLA